jgi:hypothetical protein
MSQAQAERPRVRYSKLALMRVFLASFAALALPIIFLWTERAEQAEKRGLLEEGRTVRARIVSLDRTNETTKITFSYPVDGAVLTGSAKKQNNEMPNVKVGEDTEIVYWSRRPAVTWFGSGLSRDAMASRYRDMVLASVACFGVFGFFASRDAWQIARQMKLARHGTITEGIVRGVYRASPTHDGITYEFQTEQGATVNGRSPVGPGMSKTLPPGTIVPVYYDPKNPARNVIPHGFWAARLIA